VAAGEEETPLAAAGAGAVPVVDCASAAKAFCAVLLAVDKSWLSAVNGLIWTGEMLLVAVTIMNSFGAA